MFDPEKLYTPATIHGWGLLADSALNENGEARGLALRWSKLQRDFQGLAPDPEDQVWHVCCDVFILDADYVVPNDLVLVAREVRIEGAARLVLAEGVDDARVITSALSRDGKPASLDVVYGTAEAVPVALPQSDAVARVLSLDANGRLAPSAWEPGTDTANWLTDALDDGGIIRLGVGTLFQVATLVEDDEPDLAMAQIAWVAALAEISPASQTMAAQARSQLGRIANIRQGLVVVPPLDFAVYTAAAADALKVLEARNEVYQTWVGMSWQDSKWLDLARQTVALKEGEADLSEQMEKRRAADLKKVRSARDAAATQLIALRQDFFAKTNDFKAGVKIWERDETIKASIELAVNIIKLGVEVGKLAAAGGAGGAGAGASAAEGAEGAEIEGAGEAEQIEGEGEGIEGATGETGETGGTDAVAKEGAKGSKVEGIKKLAGSLGGVGEAGVAVAGSVQKIIQIGKTADALQDMSENTLASVNAGLGKTFTVAPLKGLDVITGGAQVWKTLTVAMDDIFKLNEKLINEIPGGPAFRVSFRKLVVGAEAFCNARLAVAAAANDLAEAKLREHWAERAVEIVKVTEQNLEADQTLLDQLKQAAFDQMLISKRAVFMELEKFQAAIRYYTLMDEGPDIPRITSTVVQFTKGVSQVTGYKYALEQIDRPGHMHDVTVRLPVTAANRAADGSYVVQVGLDHPDLKHYARVRIDSADIGVFAADGSRVDPETVRMESSGTYRDRNSEHKEFLFTGNPWDHTLVYDEEGNSDLEAGTYSRFEQKVFKPTPFTTWIFHIRGARVPDDIARIELTLSGEGTGIEALA